MDFVVPTNQRAKIIEREKINRYLSTAKKTQPAVEHESDGDTSDSCWTWNGPHRLGHKTERIGNQRKNREFPDQSIGKIGSIT